MTSTTRAIIGAAAGLAYGWVLWFMCIFAAGGGHGTNAPLLLTPAPLSLLFLMRTAGEPFFLAALYAVPVLWASIGGLSALDGRWRKLAVGLLVLHYASGLSVMAINGVDLKGINGKIPEGFIAWVPVYVAGQLALWWRLARGDRSQPIA